MERLARFAQLLAAPFSIAVVVHAHLLTHSAQPGREAIFIVVNLIFCVLISHRARWTIFLAVPFSIQQAYSHGSALLTAARDGRVDMVSLLVLLFLPLLLVCSVALWVCRPGAKRSRAQLASSSRAGHALR